MCSGNKPSLQSKTLKSQVSSQKWLVNVPMKNPAVELWPPLQKNKKSYENCMRQFKNKDYKRQN